MQDVVIESNDGGKARSFRALRLASIEADMLWSGGQADTVTQRPVWSMFCGSDQEMRAFAANWTAGRRAFLLNSNSRRKSDRMELLKSANFTATWQREPEGSILTTFLPELFQMDPGMISEAGAAFVVLPTLAWLDAQKIDNVPAIMEHGKSFLPEHAGLEDDVLRRLVPMSFLFCSYLDRRTRCPLISDGRFYFQFLLVCLDRGLASWSKGNYGGFGTHNKFRFSETCTADVGLAPGIAFKASHEDLEETLAEQVALYYQKAVA